MKRFFFCCIVGLFYLLPVKSQTKIDSVSTAKFGKIFLYACTTRSPKNLIIMISGDAGWKYGVREFAAEFSKMNSVVAGVNILSYYKYLGRQKSDCYTVSSDFVELAASVERTYSFSEYVLPVVMGYSSGATLVYVILSQARAGTFKGGISLGFCQEIRIPRRMCQINGFADKEIEKSKNYLLVPDSKLGNQWIVLQGMRDRICNYNEVNEFVLKCSNSRLISIPEEDHSFSRWSDFMPQWKRAYNELISKSGSDSLKNSPKGPVNDLPFKLIKGKPIYTQNNTLALFLSGDGGWYGFEQSISDRLADLGITVLGIDTRKYFWNRKTPEKMTSDLNTLLYYYKNEMDITRFILLGYSQGGELLPFLATRLKEDLKSKLISIVMLSPETTTDFEVHVSNMVGLGNRRNTYDVISEIKKVGNTKQLIIFGEGEKTSVPALLEDTDVEIVRIPGDHHYKGNSALIVQTMKDRKTF